MTIPGDPDSSEPGPPEPRRVQDCEKRLALWYGPVAQLWLYPDETTIQCNLQP